jgi:hypothetical protein
MHLVFQIGVNGIEITEEKYKGAQSTHLYDSLVQDEVTGDVRCKYKSLFDAKTED